MTTGTAVLFSALVLASGVGYGRLAAAEEKANAPSVAADLSGHWTYNRELSDDAREKMREAGEKQGGGNGGRPPGAPGGGGMGGAGGGTGGSGGGGRMGPPPGGMGSDDDSRQAMRSILEPAEGLVITQTQTEIAVEETFGETRRLHPDGKKYKTDNGAAEIKVAWKEGLLVVEKKGARGRVVETWERIPDGSRLIVNVKMEGGFGPGLTLKRVYDRQADDAAK